MSYPFRGYDSYYEPPDEWECPQCGMVWLESADSCDHCGFGRLNPKDDEPQDFDEWRDRD